MTTKLTLTAREEVVQAAKRYARRHKTSVSALFSRFVRGLAGAESGQDRPVAEIPAESLTAKVTGLAKLPRHRGAEQVRWEAMQDKYGLDQGRRRKHR